MQLICILLLLFASCSAGLPQARTNTSATHSFVLGAYTGYDSPSMLYSIDRQTGKPAWVFTPSGNGGGPWWLTTYLIPPTLSPDGATVFVMAANNFVIDNSDWKGSYGIDAQTGAVKWNFTEAIPGDARNYSLRVVTKEVHSKTSTSFVVSADGSTLFQAGGGGAIAFNATDGKRKWAYDINPPAVPCSSIINADCVGCPGRDCVWDGKGFPLRIDKDLDQTVPTVSDEHGIFTTVDGNGKLHALQMKDGKVKWEFDIHGGCPVKPDPIFLRGPPCGWIRHTKAVGDVLYVVGFYQVGLRDAPFTSTATLWALNIKDGTTKWRVVLGVVHESGTNWESLEPRPSNDGSVVYVKARKKSDPDDEAKSVKALRASDGRILWEAASEDLPVVSADDRTVYLGFFEGLVSIDAATGKQNWALINKTLPVGPKYPSLTGGWSLRAQSPDGSELYVATSYQNMTDAKFYGTMGALNAKDGSELWTLPMPGGTGGNHEATTDGITLQMGLGSPLPGGIGPDMKPNGNDGLCCDSLRDMAVFNLADRTFKWQTRFPLAGNKYWDQTPSLCPASWHKQKHCPYGGTVVAGRRIPSSLQCEGLCQTIGRDQ